MVASSLQTAAANTLQTAVGGSSALAASQIRRNVRNLASQTAVERVIARKLLRGVLAKCKFQESVAYLTNCCEMNVLPQTAAWISSCPLGGSALVNAFDQYKVPTYSLYASALALGGHAKQKDALVSF